MIKVVSDGTTAGTKVTEDGEFLKGVVAVRRAGRNLYVTRRYRNSADEEPTFEVDYKDDEDFVLEIRPGAAGVAD